MNPVQTIYLATSILAGVVLAGVQRRAAGPPPRSAALGRNPDRLASLCWRRQPHLRPAPRPDRSTSHCSRSRGKGLRHRFVRRGAASHLLVGSDGQHLDVPARDRSNLHGDVTRDPAALLPLKRATFQPDFPTVQSLDAIPMSRIYHAAVFGDVQPAELAIRIRGTDPTAFAGKLREIGASVDPNLQLRGIATAESVFKREQGLMRLIGTTVTIVMLSVIVLAAAGIYALMSFTVAQRRREIGIRAALGANRHRLLAGIFARAVSQIVIGVVVGLAGAFALERALEGEMFQGHGAVLVPLVTLVLAIVGTIAIVGPARRGLSIQPTDALREE